MTQPVIYLTFANDRNNPLDSLKEEDEYLYELFSEKRHLSIHRDSYTSVENLGIFLKKFKHDIVIFHFAGHAGEDGLFMENGKALIEGIAEDLHNCNKLKLVILNGCSTKNQVNHLLNLPSKPTIIATKAPVGDKSAVLFAKTFYSQFCEFDKNVKESFDLALADAKKIKKIKTRGLKLRESIQEETDDWIIYPESKGYTDWKLPSANYVVSNNEVNEVLRTTLLKSMSHYNKDIKASLETADESNIHNQENIILDNLPNPISEQVRKLFTRNEDASEHTFYAYISPARLERLIITYNTHLEFIAYILLSHLWLRVRENQSQTIQIKEITNLEKILNTENQEREPLFFPKIIDTIKSIFKTQKWPHFIKDIEKSPAFADSSSSLGKAILYLDTFNFKKIKSLDEEEIKNTCIEAEQMLATVLKHTASICLYIVCSVRQIHVIKKLHEADATFQHHLIKMIPNATSAFTEISENKLNYLENHCVFLFEKKEKNKRYLNLSPFLVDQNALIFGWEKKKKKLTYKHKLYYYYGFDDFLESFLFKRIEHPNDSKMKIGENRLEDPKSSIDYDFKGKIKNGQTPFLFIKEPLNAFSQLLFDKSPF